jgi:hypothetical protein
MGYAPQCIREEATFNARHRARYKLITELDLANAVNGGTFDVALGFLPPGAVLASGALVKLNAQFTGGGATSVGMTIGTSSSPAIIMATFDVFGGAASGLYVRGTAGPQVVSPGVHPSGGQNLIARFTPDAGHNLTALTAGSVEIMVPFHTPDTRYT